MQLIVAYLWTYLILNVNLVQQDATIQNIYVLVSPDTGIDTLPTDKLSLECHYQNIKIYHIIVCYYSNVLQLKILVFFCRYRFISVVILFLQTRYVCASLKISLCLFRGARCSLDFSLFCNMFWLLNSFWVWLYHLVSRYFIPVFWWWNSFWLCYCIGERSVVMQNTKRKLIS
jgi:hypothetical protein